MALTGSIRDLKINDNTYNVVSDADLTVKPQRETTSIPTSGQSIISVEKKSADVEGIKIDASETEVYDTLDTLATEGILVSASFTMAGGQIFQSAACMVNMGNYSTKTGVLEITLLPASGWIKS